MASASLGLTPLLLARVLAAAFVPTCSAVCTLWNKTLNNQTLQMTPNGTPVPDTPLNRRRTKMLHSALVSTAPHDLELMQEQLAAALSRACHLLPAHIFDDVRKLMSTIVAQAAAHISVRAGSHLCEVLSGWVHFRLFCEGSADHADQLSLQAAMRVQW